jgi:hypothetical protein
MKRECRFSKSYQGQVDWIDLNDPIGDRSMGQWPRSVSDGRDGRAFYLGQQKPRVVDVRFYHDRSREGGVKFEIRKAKGRLSPTRLWFADRPIEHVFDLLTRPLGSYWGPESLGTGRSERRSVASPSRGKASGDWKGQFLGDGS